MTHEGFIQHVKQAAIERIAPGSAERKRLDAAKLVYGIGGSGYRGITHYAGWHNGQNAQDFLEVTAKGEESPIQLAGTTLHELGHSLAGPGAGHGKAWKDACQVLGLNARAQGGQDYKPEDFDSALWESISQAIDLKDGKPNWNDQLAAITKLNIGGTFNPAALTLGRSAKYRPCPLGIGTRGGKSRGVGSGSRLRLYQCSCHVPVKVRVASDCFEAHCDRCGESFKQVLPATFRSEVTA
jgi:hypothetical protein